jgi:signal transduction histidine kinase
LAIDNTDTCLWDWNIATNELFFNEIWQKMTGYEAHEIAPDIIGWENTLHPEDKDRVLSELNDHVNGKTDMYLSIYRIITKSAAPKWVIDKGRVVEFDANHKPSRAIGTIIDIDRQKKIEEELRSLNITKDKLFSIIGHDLRGLIGTIMQISEMVSDKNALSEENLNYFLQSQKELSQNTFQLLENLLSWARFNLEQIRYNPQKILLNHLIDESILGVRYKAIQKGIDIITDYNGDHYVNADEEMVKIITRNLLNNAIKFTEKGSINISCKENGENIEVTVEDTGIGIPDEYLAIVLSDNEYHSTPGTSNERGSGLGLKLCKSFIHQNKGCFSMHSTVGKGSQFIFTLPKA